MNTDTITPEDLVRDTNHKISIAAYHKSRPFLDALENFFFRSNYLSVRLRRTKVKLDPMITAVARLRSAIVIDLTLPGAIRFEQELQELKGPYCRIVPVTEATTEGPENTTGAFQESRSLADLVLLAVQNEAETSCPGVSETSPMNTWKHPTMTDREWYVFSLGVMGYSRKEIAHRIRISVNTVDCHLQEIKRKLRIRGSVATFSRFAQEQGWRF